MKNNFLYQIAKKVYDCHYEDLGEVCIVFPNKRAGLFFSRYLSEITDKPVWSPVFMTIRELMQEFSGLQLADPLYLIFELYNSFRQEKKSEEDFDEFYNWGEMLLGDFDEVDKYLVPAEELFRNLSDLKEIEDRFSAFDKEQIEVIKQFWKWFKPEKKSVHQEKFVSLWEVLYKIYSRFNLRRKQSKIIWRNTSSKTCSYDDWICRKSIISIFNNCRNQICHKFWRRRSNHRSKRSGTIFNCRISVSPILIRNCNNINKR